MLEVRDLRAWYGHTQALFDVSFDIGSGETLALVGTNGAGKSTTVRAIAGIVDSQGGLTLDGRSLANEKAFERAKAGIAVVPEGRGLFWKMTVRENLIVGRGPGGKADLKDVLELFPAIAKRMDVRASDLSGGEQQMVSIARAVIRKPRVLMLDEPSLGLAPRVIDEVYARLRVLKELGMTILLVEQSIARAQGFADRLCLVRTGRVTTIVDSRDSDSVRGLASLALGDQTAARPL